MSLSLDEVRKVASLARLELTRDEELLYQGQLSAILDAVKLLESVDTSSVEPTSHASFGAAALRADEVKPSLPQEKGLANAPSKVGTAFAVPKIIE